MHLGYHELRNMLQKFKEERELKKNAPQPTQSNSTPTAMNPPSFTPSRSAGSTRDDPRDRDRDRDRERERDRGGYDRGGDRYGRGYDREYVSFILVCELLLTHSSFITATGGEKGTDHVHLPRAVGGDIKLRKKSSPDSYRGSIVTFLQLVMPYPSFIFVNCKYVWIRRKKHEDKLSTRLLVYSVKRVATIMQATLLS